MKYIKPIFLLLALLCQLTGAHAQKISGQWTHYPVSRGNSITALAESATKLYYLSSHKLYECDKTDGMKVSHVSGMSGQFIEKIKYNPVGEYLVAVSEDGSVDIVYGDGSVTSLFDIKNLRTPNTKGINEISFSGDYLIFSTDFGIVVYDMKRRSMVKSGIYDPLHKDPSAKSGGPASIACDGVDFYVLWSGDIMHAGIGESLRDRSVFSRINGLNVGQITSIFGREREMFYAVKAGSAFKELFWLKVNSSYNNWDSKRLPMQPLTEVWRGGDRYYVAGKEGNVSAVYDITDYTDVKKVMEIPAAVAGFKAVSASSWSPLVWFATQEGLCAYDPSKSVTKPEVDLNPVPQGITTSVENVSMLRFSADGKRLYAGTRGSSAYLKNSGVNYNPDIYSVSSEAKNSKSTSIGFFSPSYITEITDEAGRDRTVYNAPAHQEGVNFYYTDCVWKIVGPVMVGMDGMAENPLKPGELWVATSNEGLYKVPADGNGVTVFSYENGKSMNTAGWGELFGDVGFDRGNNLWVLAPAELYGGPTATGATQSYAELQMLPADKVNGDAESITAADWIMGKDLDKLARNMSMLRDHRMIFTRNTEKEYIIARSFINRSVMLVYQRGSTDSDVSADELAIVTSLTDQDGVETTLVGMTAFAEGPDGRLWIANKDYLCTVDLSQFEPGMTSMKMQTVYRKGTKDKMLYGDEIIGLSFAPDGTLWAATQTTGLYHLSNGADEIIEHFTASNSPLPSDILGDVSVSRDGAVYVGTRNGLLRYDPDKSQTATSLDDVTVSPSPVPVGYSGWFTIGNLTEGCSVAIVDASGRKLFETTSDGGSVIWNGLDTNGDRITPGAYYVTSPSARRDISDPLAKIIIVD